MLLLLEPRVALDVYARSTLYCRVPLYVPRAFEEEPELAEATGRLPAVELDAELAAAIAGSASRSDAVTTRKERCMVFPLSAEPG